MKRPGFTPAMAAHVDALSEFVVDLSREEQALFATAVVAMLFVDQSDETALKVLRAARGLRQAFEADQAKGRRRS
jgi:hypothetical protein